MAKSPFWTPSSTEKNGKITIEVYRKPTHTDRYLDFNSHHEKKHKISTASTLLNRACNLPSTADAKSKEVKHISDALKANGYPKSIISNILKKKRTTETIPSPEELVGLFFKWVEPSETFDLACLPYTMASPNRLRRLDVVFLAEGWLFWKLKLSSNRACLRTKENVNGCYGNLCDKVTSKKLKFGHIWSLWCIFGKNRTLAS